MTKYGFILSILVFLAVFIQYGRRPEAKNSKIFSISASVSKDINHTFETGAAASSQALIQNDALNGPIVAATEALKSRAEARIEHDEALDIAVTEETKKLLTENDVCGTLRMIERSTGSDDDRAILRGMLQSLGRYSDPVTLSLQEASPDDKSDRARHQNFFAALKYGGLISGRQGEIDLIRSKNILDRLIQENPNNGAYSFYKLHANRLLGSKPKDVQATLQQLSAAQYFDSHFMSYYRQILNHATDSASLLALMHHTIKSFPVMDAAHLSIYTKDAQDIPALKHAGLLMMEEGLNSSVSYYSNGFDAAQYRLGHWFHQGNYPSLEELTAKQLAKNTEPFAPPSELNLDANKCDSKVADRHVNYLRAYTEKNLKSF